MVGIYLVVIWESYGFRNTFVSASTQEPGDRCSKILRMLPEGYTFTPSMYIRQRIILWFTMAFMDFVLYPYPTI